MSSQYWEYLGNSAYVYWGLQLLALNQTNIATAGQVRQTNLLIKILSGINRSIIGRKPNLQ
jgi:hypothetical protein